MKQLAILKDKGKGNHGGANPIVKENILLLTEKRLSKYVNDAGFLTELDVPQTVEQLTVAGADETGDLQYYAYATNFPVLTKFYPATPKTINLSVGDATFGRVDLILANKPDTVGGMGYITKSEGTPSLNYTPNNIDLNTQYIIKWIYIAPNATVGVDVTETYAKTKLSEFINDVPFLKAEDALTEVSPTNKIITQADVVGGGASTSNVNGGAFSGVIDVSQGNNVFYNDYIAGATVNLSLSATKVLGSVVTVRIKGDLMGTIPTDWEMSGQMISTLATQMNELTLLFVSINDVRLVNRISNYNDTEAPSTPLNLVASDTTDTTTLLTWDASTDNIAVASYKVRQGGVVVSTPTTNSASITGLTAETAYSFTVSALDANGNESGQSIALNVTTIAGVVILTPSSLTSLHLWLDGTDDAYITKDVNENISVLNDKSGNFNLTIASGTLQKFKPVEKYIDFIESGHLSTGTTSSVLIPNVDFHGFMVFKNQSVTQRDFFTNTLDSSNRFGIGLKGGNLGIGTYNGSAFNGKSVAFTDQTNFHKLEFKQVSGVITAYLDGVEMITSGGPNSGIHLKIILGGADNTAYKAIDFKDLFIKSGVMTTEERNNMLTYISNKHGL